MTDSPVLARRHPLVAVPSRMFLAVPRMIRVGAGLIVVGAIMAYFAGAMQKLVAPPSIEVLSPSDGMVINERVITVQGYTDQEVMLRINGVDVTIDSEGRFSDEVALQEGVNLIKVIGARKHSREMSVERRVIVKPKERQAAQLNFIEVTE